MGIAVGNRNQRRIGMVALKGDGGTIALHFHGINDRLELEQIMNLWERTVV